MRHSDYVLNGLHISVCVSKVIFQSFTCKTLVHSWACYDIENYVQRSFEDLNLCKKLTALLNSYLISSKVIATSIFYKKLLFQILFFWEYSLRKNLYYGIHYQITILRFCSDDILFRDRPSSKILTSSSWWVTGPELIIILPSKTSSLHCLNQDS